MPKKPLSIDTVRELALTLPDVEESTSYGATSFKVRGKMIACHAISKSAEPDSLVVKIPFAQRDELIASEPEVYYVTDHYAPYPSVVVRLSRVHRDALRDLVGIARQFANETSPKRRQPRKRAFARNPRR